MENHNKLYELFAEALGVNLNRIDENLEYDSVSEWDSVSHMALVASLEETFRVNFDTEDIINLSSILKTKEILIKHGIEFN